MYFSNKFIQKLFNKNGYEDPTAWKEEMFERYGVFDEYSLMDAIESEIRDEENQLVCKRGICYLKNHPDLSIFNRGTIYAFSRDAEYKAEVQESMLSHIKQHVDEDRARGVKARVILSNYSWLRYVRVEYLQGMPELFEQCGYMLPCGTTELQQAKFLYRTAMWLYNWLLTYLEDEINTVRKSVKSTHVPCMHDMVIDGVIWNPVMFRRFLPFQFANKLGVYCGRVNLVDPAPADTTLEFLNSPVQLTEVQLVGPRVNCERVFRHKYIKTNYTTSEDLRSKGYINDAVLLDSFADYTNLRYAIISYERALVVREARKGVDVTGRLQKIEQNVVHMTEGDLKKYVDTLAEKLWQPGTDMYSEMQWDRLVSIMFN